MRLRSALTPLSVLLIATLAACGGGGGGDGIATLGADKDDDGTTDTTLSEEEAEEAMLDWTACMRENGVDVPDFTSDGNGNVRIGGPDGSAGASVDEDDEGTEEPATDPPTKEDFNAAQEECGDPPQQGGDLTDEELEEMQDDALAFAECMREEGLEDFPDPDFSKMGPGAGPSVRVGGPDDEVSSDDDGATNGPFGDIDPSSPEFQAAQEACSAKNPGGPQFRTSEGPGSGSASGTAKSSDEAD